MVFFILPSSQNVYPVHKTKLQNNTIFIRKIRKEIQHLIGMISSIDLSNCFEFLVGKNVLFLSSHFVNQVIYF